MTRGGPASAVVASTFTPPKSTIMHARFIFSLLHGKGAPGPMAVAPATEFTGWSAGGVDLQARFALRNRRLPMKKPGGEPPGFQWVLKSRVVNHFNGSSMPPVLLLVLVGAL